MKLFATVSLLFATGLTDQDLVHTTEDVHVGELTEGDIMVDAGLVERLKALEGGEGTRRRLGLSTNPLWKGDEHSAGVMYYDFADDFPIEWRLLVRVAMSEMEEALHPEGKCIRFVEIHAQQSSLHHVKFVRKPGCWSYFGNISVLREDQGYQELSLDPSCWIVNGKLAAGVVQHELMHALGFVHEQSRSDRDDFVKINLENVAPEDKRDTEEYKTLVSNWKKWPRGVEAHDTAYDYNSIMHYRPFAGSYNGLPIIEKINQPYGSSGKQWQAEIERSLTKGLTAHDIFELRMAYSCPKPLSEDSDDARCDEMFLEEAGDFQCPDGSRLVTVEEARTCKESLCSRMDRWDIAEIFGGSMSGPGYGCPVNEGSGSRFGHDICIPYAQEAREEDSCYIGCYRDDSQRDMELQLPARSIKECRAECTKRGFKYFSKQYGHECFCGNAYATKEQYKRIDEKACTKAGWGPRNGGAWANSVFMTKCFNDRQHKCYSWTSDDLKAFKAGESKKDRCESRGQGFVYAEGNESLAPGCESCGCCQPR